ncbi:hypothetical protein CUR178_07229 [Leishmania enriettii]|uniref:Uncharacterized protein n=1 Tax=Leishmania enriettii TaxID=5663 RepID=A0A836HNI7_LEIEN|nr:hypothetical protein CUR178_07229 [Leishmania enriettii]
MSSNAAENPSVEKREEAHQPTTTATVDAATNRSSERGLKGWKNRLMNWRSSFGSTDGSTGGSDNGGTSKAAAAACDVTAKSSEVHGQHCAEGGKPSVTASKASEAVVAAKAGPVVANASPARPINIWLRRALERQVESAIAEAIRDGKPLPEASVATVARVALEVSAETPAEAAAGEPEKSDADTSAKVSVATPATPKTSFAELMRRHREGLVPPSAQPPVKATKVVKRPKVMESPQPVVKPTAMEEAPTQACNKKRAVKVHSQEHTAPSATPLAKEESEPTQTTSTTEADSGATPSTVATVHQAAVRKRPKATNSASAKRTQETSAATSVMATPTHVTTVKGKASLEELRARRNRTTGGGASHHNTPTPAEGGSGAASSSGTGNAEGRCSQQDEYTDSALDAVSRLLLRYCLGGRPTATAPSTAAADGAGVSSSSPQPEVAPADESPRSPSETTTTELDFFNELMALFESNSLTAASLELLRELFQHVRVLPRPPSVSSAGKGGESADGGASASQNGEAEMDAEAYCEAARRREYVQQVIMVLLNRLKHMKAQEQRQRQQNSGGTTASAAAAPPQPVLGHSAPLIKVGGMPLAPQPTPLANSWISNTRCALMPPPTAHQQQQSGMMCPTGQRTSSAAPWPSMVEMARACPDEAGAAAFTSAMMAYGYPNPYAHLTVFSQHQPVAPPFGWPSSLPSPTFGAPHDRLGSHIPETNSNVSARLVASPFPGAFPIIPPPANMNTTGAEDREMQELFRMIRAQLTQPLNKKSLSRSTNGSRVESSVSVSGEPPVEVSPAERAVLRHVQMDFKKHLEQQQQQAAAAAVAAKGSSEPQTVSTPPPSMTTPPETDVTQPLRLLATPGATADTPDPVAGAVTGTEATCVPSEKFQHPPILLTHQAGSLQMMEEAARESFSAYSTTALAEEGGISAGETAPVKSRRTTLSLNAEPFVPGGARGGNGRTATAIFAPAPTANSTPKKTTFNYHAKPFVPSGSVNAPPTISPQNRAQISAAAQALAPPQQQTVSFSPTATSFTPKSAPPVNAFKAHTPLMPLPPGTAADPWASYELFARWRDMMENYYQHVFAMQHMPATATGMPSPSPTAGGGSVLPAIMTPPRPA